MNDRIGSKILESSVGLQARMKKSEDKLNQIRGAILQDSYVPTLAHVSLFAAGSIGRREVGEKSDLDIFALSCEPISRIQEYKLFASVISVNSNLKFPELSNDGQYLRVFFVDDDRKKAIGSPRDDHENWFTARMLLLLESVFISNEDCYLNLVERVCDVYFRDQNSSNAKSFRPVFLLNDVLRYWRTLCLNYEEIRHNPDKPWRKKNVNLKFSRKLTVFSTVLALITYCRDRDEFLSLTGLTPLQRLSKVVDALNDNSVAKQFEEMLVHYEKFLAVKETDKLDGSQPETVVLDELELGAKVLTNFLKNCISHENSDQELASYILI